MSPSDGARRVTGATRDERQIFDALLLKLSESLLGRFVLDVGVVSYYLLYLNQTLIAIDKASYAIE